MTAVPVKVRDYLETDEPIRGQSYACLSFVCPEKILKDKQVYLLNKFLQSFATDMNIMFNNLAQRFSEDAGLIESLRTSHDYVMDGDALQEKFKAFLAVGLADLEEEFHKANDFQTTMRGVKVRGVYGSLEEARARCEKLNVRDPNHNIWVGEVGTWLPFADNPDELKDQEYAETTLNTLMKQYNENMEMKDVHFAERSRAMKENISKENEYKKQQATNEAADFSGESSS
eukprot:gene19681-26368_t